MNLCNEKVDVVMTNGEVYKDVLASVQKDKIYIDGITLPITKGTQINRLLKENGLVEKYMVTDCNALRGGSLSHWELSVEKL
jgi:hypothetical protein